MTLPLHPSWVERLVALPESGMGYQVLELRRLGPRPEHVVVANASEALEPTPGQLTLRERAERELQDRIAEALQGPPANTEFRVLPRAAARAKGVAERGGRPDGPASEAVTERSMRGEMFLRFSAFANDHRILEDGSVVSGTYVTTHSDGILVESGTIAVRRYALPNPMPAVHRYFLRPPGPIPVKRGVVQPNFGQPGGGDEVIFVTGAGEGTCYQQDKVPPV